MPILTLAEFKSSAISNFTPGVWTVEYHDRTHLPAKPDEAYITLGQIKIEDVASGEIGAFFNFHPAPLNSSNAPSTEGVPDAAAEEAVETSYEIEPLKQQLEAIWKTRNVDGNKKGDTAARCILDQLGEAAVRLGLIRPYFDIDDPTFATRKFATVVLDTNSLRDGAIRHLKERFIRMQIWVVIPTVSIMEMGERMAYMTSKGRDGCNSNNSGLIRTRPQVTIAPQEVEWTKANFPTETLELAPELLRSFGAYEKRRGDPISDPDRLSGNDRLILEGIKDLRRQRGLHEGIYLMSSDKDMSRLAHLEGIHTIYPSRPSIDELARGVYSLRYSLEAQTYVGCSVQRFLWDLTHVFSKIRLRCLSGSEVGRGVDLFYYFQSKLVSDWVDDKLEVTEVGPNSDTNTA